MCNRKGACIGGYFLIVCQALCILTLGLIIIITAAYYVMKKHSPIDIWLDSNLWRTVASIAFLCIPVTGYKFYKRRYGSNDIQTTQERKVVKITERLDKIYRFTINGFAITVVLIIVLSSFPIKCSGT